MILSKQKKKGGEKMQIALIILGAAIVLSLVVGLGLPPRFHWFAAQPPRLRAVVLTVASTAVTLWVAAAVRWIWF